MTHVKALEAGQSNQGTSEPITPDISLYFLNEYICTKLTCTNCIDNQMIMYSAYVTVHNVHTVPEEFSIFRLISCLKCSFFSNKTYFL